MNLMNINRILFTFWSIGLLLLFSSSVTAQSLSSKKPYVKEKSYYQEIPFEYVRGKIIIPVTVQGEVYRFILDTGAPNILSKSLAKKAGIIALDSLAVSDANETKKQMALVKVPKLSLGNLNFLSTTAIVHEVEIDDIFSCFEIDGFIGSNMLHHSVVQINNKEKTLLISDDIKKLNVNKKNKTKLQLFGDQKSPYTWIKLKGIGKNKVLLDTGMEGTYDISLKAHRLFAKKDFYTPLAKGTGSSTIGLFGTGKSSIQYRVMIKDIELSGTVFKNTLAETTNDTNSRIGASFFEQGTATFDFKEKKFYFNPYISYPDLSEKLLGFSPTLKDKKIIVGIVWDDALRTQMSPGDEIISVNGQALSAIPTCTLLTKTSIFKSRDSLVLEIKNDKKELVKVNMNRKFYQ